MKRYLAIDIGASSGRHIVGWKEDGEIRTEEATWTDPLNLHIAPAHI